LIFFLRFVIIQKGRDPCLRWVELVAFALQAFFVVYIISQALRICKQAVPESYYATVSSTVMARFGWHWARSQNLENCNIASQGRTRHDRGLPSGIIEI